MVSLARATQLRTSNYVGDAKEVSGGAYQTDAFRNSIARTGLGTQNLINGSEYTFSKISHNLQLLNNLYRSNWIVKNIIDIIPEDMTKTWFSVSSDDLTPEEITKIRTYQNGINLKESIVRGLKWSRLYGGAVGLILLRNQEDLSVPIDYTKIMPDDFRGLHIVDRWSGIYPEFDSLTTDINDPNFGHPEYYTMSLISDTSKQVRVHYSRLVKFTGKETPYNQHFNEDYYWGESILESVYEELIKRDNVSSNMISLTFKANLSIYSVKNLDTLLATANGLMQKRFYAQIQAQSVLESNMGVRVIDSEDKFEQSQYNFAGLKDVYEAVQQDLSGSAGIPVVKLFQRSPSGLNATGKADMQMYNDRLTIERESSLEPIVKRLLPLIVLSAIGKFPDDLEFQFEAIRNPDEAEKATIGQKRWGMLIDAYTNGLIPQGIALAEFKKGADETGVGSSITDEMISKAMDVYVNDIVDPISGIGGSGLISSSLSEQKEPEEVSAYEYSEDL